MSGLAGRGLFRRDKVFDFLTPSVSERLNTDYSTLLYMEDVTVSFDGFKAINDLNFIVENGELRCLIGANGAGKTTMMDIITGKTRPDSGRVIFGENIDLLDLNESEIALAGIGRKFQKPTVFETSAYSKIWNYRWLTSSRFGGPYGASSIQPKQIRLNISRI